MPIINAKIATNEHSFTCAAGEEERFRSLVDKLNVRLDKITKSNNKANEMRILVLACLLMEDEIDDLQKTRNIQMHNSNNADETIVNVIDSVSEYIEKLAKKVEAM
jgi:cell division protein ZapA (FtsZ GTPase activity inhibitor)